MALVTVWIVWGSTYLAIRVTVETIPPLLAAGFRYLIAGAVMFAVLGPRHARGAQRPTARQLRSIVIIGVLLLVGGNGLVSIAETSIDSGLAALIVATVPVWMVLINAAVTKTGVTATMMLTLVLGTVGVGVLMGGPGANVDLVGAGAVLVAALSWSAGSVYARHASLPSHPLVVTSLEMLAGGLVLIAAGAATGEFSRLDLAAISVSSIAGFVWLVVPGAMITFSAYVYANATLPTDTVASYAYVNPMIAVTLGTVLGKEPLSANLLLGGVIIVSAVALVVNKAVGKQVRRRLRPSEELSR